MQGRSDGPISLVMVECSSDGDIRGIARGELESPEGPMKSHLPNGVLTLTIEPKVGQRYQGIIKKNKAARHKSRLNAKVKALAAS